VIQQERHGRVLLLTIDRPGRRNALDVQTCDALHDAVSGVRPDVRCVVITGAGTSFCAGADLTQVYGETFRASLYAMLAAITSASLPVIAAVNGPAIGAGTQLAIACDLRVAADGAMFAVPTGRNGLAVDTWTIRRLALLAGGAARLMLLAARPVAAERAHTLGLVDELGDLDAALRLGEEVGRLAPLTLRHAKRTLEATLEPAVDDADLEAAMHACWDSEDAAEARSAAAEGRSPVFRGL
jgi:enoyl-CoA hydratase